MLYEVITNFNNIIQKIIEKSLFTERQIEIILNQKDLREVKFSITKGAYYRITSYNVCYTKLLRIFIDDVEFECMKLAKKLS